MIIWISGAYGVGKSTLAEALAQKMGNALIFDAEEVGNAVRENYPDCPWGYIFEDYPLWGRFCRMLLEDIHEKFQKDILVPMTIVRPHSLGILEALRGSGIDTRLILLEASYQTVRHRILARGEEEGCWCMENIEMAAKATQAMPGIHIPTDGKPVETLCREVLGRIQSKSG